MGLAVIVIRTLGLEKLPRVLQRQELTGFFRQVRQVAKHIPMKTWLCPPGMAHL